MNTRTTALLLVPAAALALAACESAPPEPQKDATEKKPAAATQQAGDKSAEKRAPVERPKPQKRKVTAKPVAEVQPSPDDPLKGKWTLEDATKGLPASKTLKADIETDLGTLTCTLFADKAPITVANFIGLARGIRPWKTAEGKWEKKPAYDGTVFHRIIKGFMIQGGDPLHKNGGGETGYVIPDEVWEDANHDRPGLLCMANRGKNTNSGQFFITDEAAHHLDNGYTIFGECGPVELVHKIASVDTRGETPVTPPVIKTVKIKGE